MTASPRWRWLWALPPAAFGLLCLWFAFGEQIAAQKVRYYGVGLSAGQTLDHPQSVEDIVRAFRDVQFAGSGWQPGSEQDFKAWRQRNIDNAPQTRAYWIEQHDNEIAYHNGEAVSWLVFALVLLAAAPFMPRLVQLVPPLLRNTGTGIESLAGALSQLRGPPRDPAIPLAVLRDSNTGQTIGRRGTLIWLLIGLVLPVVGIIIIVQSVNDPTPGYRAAPLLGIGFIISGLFLVPFMLVLLFRLAGHQRVIDREYELRQQTRAAFHQQAAQGSAAFQTGFTPVAISPAAQSGPAPAAPAKPSVANDEFRIDLPPPSSSS